MSNKHVNGTKRRHEEDGRSKRQEDIEEDYQRKRRRNSKEKSQELSKKQRRDARYSDDHTIDSKFPEWHDKEGHFNYRLGESLGDQLDSSEPERRRYKLIDKLGQGTFGLVLLAWDRIEQCFVAVKIVRAIKKYTESALTEIDILTRIQRSGLQEQEESELEQISSVSQSREVEGDAGSLDAAPERRSKPKRLKQHIPKHCCITLESWFQYKEHICMVFQKYGLSLYDYLKQNHFKPLDRAMIKDIAYNLFASLYYLHEGLQLIHTDLKPENILFVDDCRHVADGNKSPDIRSKSVMDSSEIKIIDLGSATFEHDYHSTIISTRHYRAPEVILQVGWSFPSDVWSVGCILLELYTGRTCFQTHHNGEHLAMIEALLGEIPVPWLLANQDAKHNVISDYFESGGDRFYKSLELKWYNNPSTESKRRVRAVKSLRDLIAKEDEDFYQLMSKTLAIDPSQRLTASAALEEPYFDSVREKYFNNPNGAESKQLKRSVSASLDIGGRDRDRDRDRERKQQQSTTPSNKRQLDEDRTKESNTAQAHHEAFLQLQEDEKRQKLEQVQQQLLLHQQWHQHRLQQQPSISATNNNNASNANNASSSQHVQYQQYHLPLHSASAQQQQQPSHSRDSEAMMSHSKSRANSLSSGLGNVSHAPDDSPRYQTASAATNSNNNSNNSNSHLVNSYHNYNRGDNTTSAVRFNTNTNESSQRYDLEDCENDDIDSVPDRSAPHLLDKFGFDSEKHNSQVAESLLSNLLLRSNSSFSRMDASTQSQPHDEKLA